MISLSQRDRELMWHPFTQEKTAELPLAITRGDGAYLYEESGKRYLDLISSWWVNLHGHGNPVIAKAIYEQALELEHVIFAGFTHKPAVTLCEKLRTVLPDELRRFFFSDNGSTAVEIALKMAYQFWANQGDNQRTLFLSFEGDYHGDTFGAMSVSKESGFHDLFKQFFFRVETIPYPATWDNDFDIEEKEQGALDALDKYLAQHANQTAALIIEPLAQGASGMRMCRPQFLQKVIDRVTSHSILIIFDEVMTGFGRTGTLFAMEQAQHTPDILCLSKGLTGGFLPLALTITNEKIYNAFLDDSYTKAFSHGHSYTANPLGCAAGIASLDLLLQPDTLSKIKDISVLHEERIKKLYEHFPRVVKPRVLGTIAAVTLENLPSLKNQFLEKGLLIRPLGDTVYLLPPYCTKLDDLHHAYDVIEQVFSGYV